MKINKMPFILFSIFLIVLVLLFGCNSNNKEVTGLEEQINESDIAQTENKLLNLEYSDSFSVEYISEDVKKLVDGEGRSFLLVPKGQNPPNGFDFPVIYTPINNVLASSSTQVSLMQPLGVIDSISAVMSDKESWFFDEVTEGFENGSITFVGTGRTPDYELIQEINPEVAIVYGGTWGQFEMMEKFDELGITYVVNNEYMEEDPFARMEWIKFLAAFYDKEKEAEQFFSTAVKKVEGLSSKLPDKDKTSVLWASIRDGQVSITNPNSYVGKLIDMAGGDYVFKELPLEVGESANLTPEEFYAQGINADVFIYGAMASTAGSLEDIIKQAPIMEDMKPFKEGNVWVFQDWYWQILHKTDEILEDLAIIYYPELFPGQTPRHFVKVE